MFDPSVALPDTEEPTHHVLLVPGFFGFGKFGELTYFSGVARALTESFERMGKRVVVTEVATLPTASIRQRAARVLEAIAAVAAQGGGPIHIVGHSTGGLDARLAIAPTASLPTDIRFRQYDRIRTLVTVCCPHFGTPVATFFTSAMGKPLLRIFALYFIWLLRRRVALAVVLWIGYRIVRLRDPFRRQRSAFDELYEKLLHDLSETRRLELIEFLGAVSSDQSLLFQLTPAGCDILNACTADPNLRYGSVVARARRPTWKLFFRSILDLYAQIVYPIYAVLRFIAARGESKLVPEPADAQRDALQRFFGELPSASDSDGIVPTRSQLWGELVHATSADHLDVVGLYGQFDPQTGSADWIPSFTGFGQSNFEALWEDVGRFLAQDERQAPSDRSKVGTERTERDLPARSDRRMDLRFNRRRSEPRASCPCS
jgi:pimeloyl-ACP methyl ester carboxylesterase